MICPIRITYDPEGDILFVTFGSPTPSTGYQLSDQILLRVNPDSWQAAGLTILNFSVHARSRRPIALSGLKGDTEVRVDVRGILTTPPVNRFLGLSEDEKGVWATILQPALGEAVAA
ncbi:MAG: DUF2283 domain-containing protein [Chloroflexi bacterium]|nr:DUF2283 domain-containing protein [candidate division NC10 bacterium]MBI2916913.1 DUF2283 domain-containing protein [Chloroflexota bacterium]